MATPSWVGRAGAVPQVSTYTVGGTVAAGSTFEMEINTRKITVTATGASTSDAATLWATALTENANDYGEFGEITWEASGAVVTATGPANGAPFTATATAGGSGTPSVTPATVTAGTGPNYWTNADNWDTGSVPVTADAVTVNGGPSILYGLANSAVQLASLTVGPLFTGEIGLPATSDGGYVEYRPTRLAVGATLASIDTPSGRIRLNLGNDPAAVTVLDTGRAGPGEFALDILANDAATTVVVNRGQVGIAAGAGEVSVVASVRTAFRDRRDSDATVELGAGLTVTTVEQTGGEVALRCAATTVTREGGALVRYGTGAITTLDNRGGAVDDYGTGTITTLNQAGRYTRRGLAALTITNANLYAGGETNDRSGVVTWTNAVEYVKCGPPSAPSDTENQPPAVHHFNFGYARKITVVDV